MGLLAATAKNNAATKENHEAKIWQIVTPGKESLTVTNLRHWLIDRCGRRENLRVCAILRNMSKQMTTGGEA